MPGRLQNLGCQGACFDGVRLTEAVVDLNLPGCWHTDPRRLHIKHLEEGVVILVQENGRSRGGSQLHGSADVIDVRVGDDDLLNLKLVLPYQPEHLLDVVPRIDHDCFVTSLVSDYRTVALQRTDGNDLMNHEDILDEEILRPGNPGKRKGPPHGRTLTPERRLLRR